LKKVVTKIFRDYNVRDIREFIEGGLEDSNVNGQLHQSKVLLKPNLVMGKMPQKAVNTHPKVVQAIAELLLDRSCDV
jgi:uncharacterized protein (DUF362 family)